MCSRIIRGLLRRSPAEFGHGLLGDAPVWGAGWAGNETGESEHRSLMQIASACSENPSKKLDAFARIQAHSGPLSRTSKQMLWDARVVSVFSNILTDG